MSLDGLILKKVVVHDTVERGDFKMRKTWADKVDLFCYFAVRVFVLILSYLYKTQQGFFYNESLTKN